jgi:hypothetical protein
VLAEARAHALAGTRSAADRAAVLGSEECQALMQQLQERMLAIASDTGAGCVTCVLHYHAAGMGLCAY